jgi:SAM-dependent methyltransferase
VSGKLRQAFARLWRRLRGGELGPVRAALSVGVGLFIGSLPLYGLHFLLCALVCLPLRLDLVVAYLAANVSNPLVAPFLLVTEVEVGSLALTGSHAAFDLERARATGVAGFAAQAAVGSLLVGGALAVVGASVAWAVAARRNERARALQAAVQRTLGRFRACSPRDRAWARSKLRWDPALSQLAALDGDFGDLVDLGCGRGQLALALLELGRARSVRGWDWDETKIAAARMAGGAGATFDVGDAARLEPPECDTLLLFDLLHYLEPREQAALLERCARALRPGGRLIVRDLDREAGVGARLGMLAEKAGVRAGANRGARLHFVSPRQLGDSLERLGLACEIVPPSGLLPNAVLVAQRPGFAARQ